MRFKNSKATKENPSSSEVVQSQGHPGGGDYAADHLGIAVAVLNTTKDLVPIDLAKTILGTIANILTIAQSVIQNKSDFLAIADGCNAIKTVVEEATEGLTDDDLQGSLGSALRRLNISINHINSDLLAQKKHTVLERVFSVTIDRNKIVGWQSDLDRSLTLFNTEVNTGTSIRTRKLDVRLEGITSATIVTRYQLKEPPSCPSMFYGRNDLMAELTNLVINDKDIALIGPGGMGKSSIAKAILHEPLVNGKFIERRFFVTYDGLDPSTITFELFMARIARDIGLELVGADPLRQICTFLRSATTLIVLDNAETFEEASGPQALDKIPSAIAEIGNIPGVILILTSRSRRNAPNVPWITKDVPPLDINSALNAFFQIYGQANGSHGDYEGEITNLLKELEFHPLSINLLATAAAQNNWSLPKLLERWKNRPSAVLDHGKGKLQSLSATMNLSLSSPSVNDLGERGHVTLAVIAFLPQGLNENLAVELLPSIPDIDTICDALCMQSLVYRQGTFIKMLTPIRHYVRSSPMAALVSTCFDDVRDFYYRTIEQCSEERDKHADVIISDHLNIEYIIAAGLAQIPNNTQRTCDICAQFLLSLKRHLPCTTSLASAIFNIVDNPSTWIPKAACLWNLGALYVALSQFAEVQSAYETAQALYLAANDHEQSSQCVIYRADLYRCQGRFIQAQRVLEDFQLSDSWMSVCEATKAEIWFFLDDAKGYTFAASADELYSRSMKDPKRCLVSRICRWRAKLYYGEDTSQVGSHLEELLSQTTDTGDLRSHLSALHGLAEVAFYQGRLSKAIDILQTAVDMLEGKDSQTCFWFMVYQAFVASHQGNYDIAREIIHKSSKPFDFLLLPSARLFLHRTYASAHVELAAGEYETATSHFNALLGGCYIQHDLHHKAGAKRGLGEVAFACGDFALAARYFAEMCSVCLEMGVPPQKIDGCIPFQSMPARLEGWKLFFEGRSPFTESGYHTIKVTH